MGVHVSICPAALAGSSPQRSIHARKRNGTPLRCQHFLAAADHPARPSLRFRDSSSIANLPLRPTGVCSLIVRPSSFAIRHCPLSMSHTLSVRSEDPDAARPHSAPPHLPLARGPSAPAALAGGRAWSGRLAHGGLNRNGGGFVYHPPHGTKGRFHPGKRPRCVRLFPGGAESAHHRSCSRARRLRHEVAVTSTPSFKSMLPL